MEYAVATGPEPFLWTHEISMPWWQLLLLEHIAVLAAATLAAGIIGVRCGLHRWLRHGKGRATKVTHLKSA